MFKSSLIVIAAILAIEAQTTPENGEIVTNEQTGTDIDLTKIRIDLDIIAYAQNFKTVMAEYVYKQYRNLTINEIERVKLLLEEFLTKFAKDLKEIVQRQQEIKDEDLKHLKVEDGMPDATFEDIRQRIKNEFPDVTENGSKEIVYALRKSLFETRQKIDQLIRESQRAQTEFDEEDY